MTPRPTSRCKHLKKEEYQQHHMTLTSLVTDKLFHFRRCSGLLACIGAFCVFGMLQFRDSLLLRPHPALWRVVLSLGVVYQLFLVFLLFQVRKVRPLTPRTTATNKMSSPTHASATVFLLVESLNTIEQARCKSLLHIPRSLPWSPPS